MVRGDTVSFLPIFTLAGQAGKLFTPLAYTKTFAMFTAAILSITLAPPLMVLLLMWRRHQVRVGVVSLPLVPDAPPVPPKASPLVPDAAATPPEAPPLAPAPSSGGAA
jgi:multidrug efflux pump subunit AcrB